MSSRVDEAAAPAGDHVAHLAEDRRRPPTRRPPRPGRRSRSSQCSWRTRSRSPRGPRLVAARYSMSSSVRRIRRPLPSPSNGIEVRDGQPITIRSPSPAELLISCAMQPVAEGQQQADRDRAPDDAEDRQEGAQLLATGGRGRAGGGRMPKAGRSHTSRRSSKVERSKRRKLRHTRMHASNVER